MRMKINDLSRRCADLTFTVPTSTAVCFQLCIEAYGLDLDSLIDYYLEHIVSLLSSVGGDIFAEDCP